MTQGFPTATEATTGWRVRFPALQHRDFRILWFGMFFSSATMMFQFYAQGWFILGLAGSAGLLGVLGVARGAGMLVFSLWGGALADRMDRRRLLMLTQSAAICVFGLLSVLILLDRINLWGAFALIFVAAAVESMDGPTRQALLPHLVPREHIPNAVALFTAAGVSSYAFLPPLAGLAIETIGSGGAFAISIVGHVAVIVALLVMRSDAAPGGRPTENLVKSIGLGVQYASARPNVLWVILFSLLLGSLGFPIISTLAPFWMKNELHLSAGGWTVMGWIWGLGTVVSTGYLSIQKPGRRHGRMVIVSVVGFAATLIVFGLTRWLPLAALMWALNGTFYTANMISVSSLLQTIVETRFIGRVMSLRLISSACSQFAAAPLGAIADGIGMGRMVPAVAAALAVCVLGPAALAPAARRLDPVPPEPEAVPSPIT